MSTDVTYKIDSTSLENTEKLARDIGSRLRGGEAIELVSDLGGGKTTFVRGLVAGAGSSDTVGSPSFTISREYQADSLTIHHYDFYRLNEPGVMADELQEVLTEPHAIVVVEWADVIEDVLPVERVKIRIETTGETARRFTIELPKKYVYLRGGQ
jgi:tRNA threonylcarbamoyladenosine biosynthesis protein TsaE